MLKKEIQDQVLIATLTDQKTNAIDLDTLRQLAEAVNEVNADPAVKGLVLTGEGRFFSSGFSLPMFIDFKTADDVVGFFTEEESTLVDFFTCSKPVVSAMNGHSAAMGMILAMASDYRIVGDHPKIKLGMSEIKIGLALSVAQAAIMRFGLDTNKRFRDVMYFGEMVDPKSAKELEMVDEVVEQDNLISRAKEIVSLWIDTPNRPFVQLKASLKKGTVEAIRTELAAGEWKETLSAALLNPNVKATLEFVQASMEK